MWKFAVGQEVIAEASWFPPMRLTVTKQGAGYKKNAKGVEVLAYFLVDKNEKLYYFSEQQLKGLK